MNVRCIHSSDGIKAEEVYEALTGVDVLDKSGLPPAEEFAFAEEQSAPLIAHMRREASSSSGSQSPTSSPFSLSDFRALLALFKAESAKTFGSLIRIPEILVKKLPEIVEHVDQLLHGDDLNRRLVAERLAPVAEQAWLLGKLYDAVVANPPYMGGRGMNGSVKTFAEREFPDSKSDLFAMFIERGLELTKGRGHSAMVTMQSWMFLSSYEKLRERLLDETTIECMVHMANAVMGIAFGTAATVWGRTKKRSFQGDFSYVTYEDLTNQNKPREFPIQSDRLARASAEDFKRIPGSPIAYWASRKTLEVFFEGRALADIVYSDGPCKSGDDEVFLRRVWEVSSTSVSDRGPWRLCSKGGASRPYFGNIEHILLWTQQAREHYKKDRIARITPKESWDLQGITWTIVSASEITTFRLLPTHSLFNSVSPTVFVKSGDEDLLFCILGFLNSRVAAHLLAFLNPTLALNVQNLLDLPWRKEVLAPQFVASVRELVRLYARDWCRAETAVGFSFPVFFTPELQAPRIADSWRNLNEFLRAEMQTAKAHSVWINEHVIACYGLSEELSPEVIEDQIPLARPDRKRDIAAVMSYAVGCMMGRYSLEESGLIYAHSGNEGFDPNRYTTFPADADGIIPLTEYEWFEDDATNRLVEFIGVAWPKEHQEENLGFVVESLGSKEGEHARDTIRRYFATGFFKDHLQTYKRRPIYWLFCSGKERAFQCLVYLHRYNEGTLARIRTEYVIPLQGKMAARIEHLERDITAATSTSHRNKLQKERDTLRKQLDELRRFDEKLRHYADQRISLDLDDGVKVNYAKFGDLLAEVKAVTGGSAEED